MSKKVSKKLVVTGDMSRRAKRIVDIATSQTDDKLSSMRIRAKKDEKIRRKATTVRRGTKK